MSDLPCQTLGAVPRLARLARLDSFTRSTFSKSSAKVETAHHLDSLPTPLGHLHAKTARSHRAPSRSCGGASKMRGESRAHRGVASDEGPSLQSPPGKVHLWPPDAHWLPPPGEPKSRRRVLLTWPEQGNISPPRTHEGGAKSGLWFSEVRHPGEGRAERAPPPRKVPHWPRDLAEGPFSPDLPCKRRELWHMFLKVNTHNTDPGPDSVPGGAQ